jgi:cobalt-precorrin-5B (C1)-methyltransferase
MEMDASRPRTLHKWRGLGESGYNPRMLRSDPPKLRRGWTTGACAAAACRAAAEALWSARFPQSVRIDLPRGGQAEFAIAEREIGSDYARAGVTKDAGDDPDVTHGCLVRATLRSAPAGGGVVFRAGEGVGTVTRPGLALAPGEPAINAVPRRMMRDAVAAAATACGHSPDAIVEISIPGGAKLAERTLNGRLGIVDGLSILGTTGIVIPYSCSAWIHSIRRGIDVARAGGLTHLAAATGSVSEEAVRRRYDLPDAALIDMGDFAGATLKYLRRHPVEKLTLAGGFAKFAKLAQGAVDLHSARSRVDLADLGREMAALGAAPEILVQTRSAATAAEILELAIRAHLPLADRIAERARAAAREHLDARMAVEVFLFGRDGAGIGHAGF